MVVDYISRTPAPGSGPAYPATRFVEVCGPLGPCGPTRGNEQCMLLSFPNI